MEKTSLQSQLFAMQDRKYQEFQSGLIPDLPKEKIIGIRMPALRSFAKTFGKTEEANVFLEEFPHTYYEENNLHMLLIGQRKDFSECLGALTAFLPYVDNWATCDMPIPKCFAGKQKELLPEIQTWIASGKTYQIRYGIGLLMRLYLDEEFQPDYLALTASVHSEEYYVNMMIAWYFAAALAKQWDIAVKFLQENRLSDWVHNKTIQKAVESCRITREQKDYLRTLRRGKNRRTKKGE